MEGGRNRRASGMPLRRKKINGLAWITEGGLSAGRRRDDAEAVPARITVFPVLLEA